MSTRPEWVRRWEDLSVPVQIAVLFPLWFVILLVAHLTVLNQPVGRGLGYAAFWAIPATAILIVATRTERARRLAAEAEREGRGGR